MISEKMKNIMKSGSAIRAMFEEGKRLSEIYGKENVYDFSLGNPSIPAPEKVNKAIKEIVDSVDPLTLHGYMTNSGYVSVRKAVADDLNKRYNASYTADNIVMTVGAAGGLNVALKAIVNAGEEVIVIAPYFGEYDNYISNVDGQIVVVPPNPPTFQPDLSALKKAITPKTRAVIVNTPNNPTGVIYGKDTLRDLGKILKKKSEEYSTVIYIISDEPYRELAYDGEIAPFIPNYYSNTIIGYSYSKSLSLPGERIGYLAISDKADGYEELLSACNVATRILGFVNAPSLQQLLVEKCIDEKTDLSAYDENRKLLYSALSEYGFECVKPQGAFYLFVKCPINESDFVSKAKSYNILVVGGKSFCCEGYVRIAYCVSNKMIRTSLPSFEKLAKEIFGN
ncbi:MAG: pyridoxal phosphate-dependent aminotransferase [Clostridia bacterium]|nr:pyridoxal phosphate-dependent aminotransferase [Clostridia bacterium]MDE7215678.1 pyridoxal phosphate-dependent aminotransferase [Clostridia bacterium]